MKHLKTFNQLFENRGDHENDLRNILAKIPGESNTETSLLAYNTSTPGILFEISTKDIPFWKSISKKENAIKAIKWYNEIDDMFWGEDEQERKESASAYQFWKIDLESDKLEQMRKEANMVGLAADSGHFAIKIAPNPAYENRCGVTIRFKESESLAHEFRGNITGKNFGIS